PVAFGERRRGGLVAESMILSELYETCVDLEEYLLRSSVRPFEKFEIIARLGRLVRRMHDAGIDQDDLALNNFLLVRRAPDSFEMLLTDFERARMRRSISWRRRWHTIAKLARVGRPLGASDRLRFLLAYLAEGAEKPAIAYAAAAVERASAALRARDYKRMRSLCLSRSRLFEPLRSSDWRGYIRRGTNVAGLTAALRSFDERKIARLGEVWRSTAIDRSRLLIDGPPAGASHVMALRFRRANMDWTFPFTRRVKPEAIWVAANWLHKLRAPVLRPLALLERRAEPGGRAVYFLAEDIEGAPLLDQWMKADGNWKAGQRAYAASLAWLSRFAHVPLELTTRDFLSAGRRDGAAALHGVHKLTPRLAREKRRPRNSRGRLLCNDYPADAR
ncbi:MAG: lipopolysaccharide kinase InaA family protein, partial [Vicinamibacteria bacterium]